MQRFASVLITAAVLSACHDRGEITGPGEGPEVPGPRFSVVVFGITDIGAPLGGSSGHATAVNDLGEVVGSSGTDQGPVHAFRWVNGAAQDLGTLAASGFSDALDINPAGFIVGHSTAEGVGFACGVVWVNGFRTPVRRS